MVIEQAKGVVAEHLRIDVDYAFNLIRRYARSNNRFLSATARELVSGTLRPDSLRQGARSAPRPVRRS